MLLAEPGARFAETTILPRPKDVDDPYGGRIEAEDNCAIGHRSRSQLLRVRVFLISGGTMTIAPQQFRPGQEDEAIGANSMLPGAF
jgi:hypothetical protein